MPYVPIGSQKTDSDKTPTLRQYIAKCEGKCPDKSFVKIIFLPGKIPNYSLVTDHNFRVSILSGNDLFRAITENIEEWGESGASLVVLPDKDRPGAFELAVDSDSTSDWERTSWGFKLDLKPPKKTRSK